MITAETGFVGLRMPNSELALALLKESGVPIAAPSANKFGHVSPSKAEHVYNDFYLDSEVTILDGGPCNFGIESTVMKICELGDKKFEFLVLRKGGVSEKALHEAVANVPELQEFSITIVAKAHEEYKAETENLEGPGQFLRHYAPNIDSFLFDGQANNQKIDLSRSVLIDFGGILAGQKDQVKHYIDLSARGSFLEAVNQLYDVLRWAETREDADSVLLADVLKLAGDTDIEGAEHKAALFDRIFRATSGKQA